VQKKALHEITSFSVLQIIPQRGVFVKEQRQIHRGIVKDLSASLLTKGGGSL